MRPTAALVFTAALVSSASAGPGTVAVENRDRRHLYLEVDDGARELLLHEQNHPGRWILARNAFLNLTLEVGTWQVRFADESVFCRFDVAEGAWTNLRLVQHVKSRLHATGLVRIESGRERWLGLLKIHDDVAAEPAASYKMGEEPPAPTASAFAPADHGGAPGMAIAYVAPVHSHIAGCGCPGYGVVAAVHTTTTTVTPIQPPRPSPTRVAPIQPGYIPPPGFNAPQPPSQHADYLAAVRQNVPYDPVYVQPATPLPVSVVTTSTTVVTAACPTAETLPPPRPGIVVFR